MSESHPAAVERVIDWVRQHPLPDGRIIPICIWGERGVGKTSWVHSYCTQRDIAFRSYHPAHDNSAADIVGLPFIDEKLERTVYARPLWLPSDNDPVIWSKAGVLFIDELNRASTNVLQGLYEPLGEGTIEHSGWKLPKQWGFICAANPPKEGYNVTGLDEALMDRMIHMPLGFDVVRWAAWAGATDVHRDLVSFTARFPTMMAKAEAELPDEIEVKSTPRSIEYLARLYEPGMDRQILRILAVGLIGTEAADALLAHVDAPDRPVTAEEILSGEFQERLGAHVAAGREDLLLASRTLLLAMLVRYRATAGAARYVSSYMQIIGPERSAEVWQEIADQAPHWIEPLRREIEAAQEPSA